MHFGLKLKLTFLGDEIHRWTLFKMVLVSIVIPVVLWRYLVLYDDYELHFEINTLMDKCHMQPPV